MKKVLVFGTFDGLHPGHLDFFRQARELGNHLAVVVGRDVTVKAVKGKLPRQNESKRLAAIKKSGLVDEVVLGNIGDPYAIIIKIKPDIIALGYDQNSFTDRLPQELKKIGINIPIFRLESFCPGIFHSSKIK